MCENMRFEFIEHTADIGVKAFGGSLEELFENAARGMFSIMIELDKVKSTGVFKVSIEARDKEQLLVDWLSELLYIHEVHNVVLNDFELEIKKTGGDGEKKEDDDDDGGRPDLGDYAKDSGKKGFVLKGLVKGEAIDGERHDFKTMVKAVTYHMLEINEAEGFITVIFDV
jgi:SHS2 domain-containing protein